MEEIVCKSLIFFAEWECILNKTSIFNQFNFKSSIAITYFFGELSYIIFKGLNSLSTLNYI